MGDKFLPIGSVVILKGAVKKVMITGYTPIDMNKKNKIYDYCGCLYPEGVMDNNNYLFNHDNIEKIFFEGYRDDEQKELSEKLKKFVENEGKDIINKIKES